MSKVTPDIQKVIECLCSLGEVIQEAESDDSETEIETENSQ